MHEPAIAQRILDAVTEEAHRRGIRENTVRRVSVAVGALRQLVPEALAAAYEALSRDTPFSQSRLDVRIVPLTVRCAACAFSGAIVPPFFQCPACGATDVTVLTGMELQLEQLETEDE